MSRTGSPGAALTSIASGRLEAHSTSARVLYSESSISATMAAAASAETTCLAIFS